MRPYRFAPELIQGFRTVSVPNVSDALDRFGLPLGPRGIVPMWSGCRKLVGAAATLKLVPLSASKHSPVIGTLKAIVDAHAGDVLVIDYGSRTDVNTMGGVAGATAVHTGLAGCVSDGCVRDIEEYRAMDFPVYARGPIQSSIRNRCGYAGHAIEVQLGGVGVRPGDLVFGDESGVLVVPRERAADVLELARELKATEDSVIAAIRRGEDPIEAHEKVRYDQLTSRKA
jgi:regulator of RNase E activity RraA